MVQPSQRPLIRGPVFIRLLAGLAGADLAQPTPSLAEQLGQWLAWSHAIALSTALDDKPAAVDPVLPDVPGSEEQECARIRQSLARAITAEPTVSTARTQRNHAPAIAQTWMQQRADYAIFRQQHLALQRSMQAATGKLRGRLRDALAVRSTEMARLAAVDAAMEAALSPREQALLAQIPDVLGEHFDRLQQAARPSTTDVPTDGPAASSAPDRWLEVFRNDRHSVLLAELDVRFQPVEALLAALRSR